MTKRTLSPTTPLPESLGGTGYPTLTAALQALGVTVPGAATPATVPNAPTITVTPGATQNSIAWTDGANGGAAITSHKLYRSTTSGFTPAAGNLIGTITTASPYTDSGLTNGTVYYYKLSAVNSVGEGAFSTQSSGTPAAPVAATVPGAPTISLNVGSNTISVFYSDGAANNGAITSRSLYRSTTSGFTPAAGNKIASPTASPYVDSTAVNGTTYFYKMSDTNSAGEGAFSAQVSGTPAVAATNLISFGSTGTGKATTTVHPNIAAQSFTIQAKITTPATFTGEMLIIGVWGDNFYGQNEWMLALESDGKAQVVWTDGPNFSILKCGTAFATNATVTIRAVVNTAAGSVDFFTVNTDGSTNSLGSVSGGGARSVRFDAGNDGKLKIGNSTDSTRQFTGNFYNASVTIGGNLTVNPVAATASSITDSTGAVWTLTQADPFTVDLIMVANYPTALPPVNASALPAYGTLAAGASNLISIDFTPGTGAEKVNTRAALDAIAFYNHISGSLDKTVGTDGIDDPSYGANYARIGRYPETSPANVHQFVTDGLKFGVTGINNNLGTAGDRKFSKNELRSGFLRLEQNFLPGMTLEFTFQGPTNPLGWQPIWLYQGRQISPRRAGVNGPYDTVTNQYGTSLPLYNANDSAPNGAKSYHEIDILDMYNNAPGVGRCLTSGTVLHEIDPRNVYPYTKTFLAASNGFTQDGYHAIADVPWNTSMNTLTFNWLGDGSSIMQYALNGVIFMEEYWEFWSQKDNFINPVNGNISPVGMCLLIGGQGVPATFGTTAGPTPSGPVLISDMDSMSMTIGRIRVWNRNITSGLTRPTTNGKAGVTVPPPGATTPATAAPVNTAPVTISGTAQVNSVLTAVPGTYNNGVTSRTYAFKVGGVAVTNTSATTYKPVSADIGKTVTVTETATNSQGSATSTSAATAAIVADPNAFVYTGANLVTTAKADFRVKPPWGGYTQGNAVFADSAISIVIDGAGGNTQHSYNIPTGAVAGTYRLTLTATRTAGAGNLTPQYFESGNHVGTWDQGNTWVTGTKRTVTITFTLTADSTSFNVTVGYFNDLVSGNYLYELQPDGALMKFERMS